MSTKNEFTRFLDDSWDDHEVNARRARKNKHTDRRQRRRAKSDMWDVQYD